MIQTSTLAPGVTLRCFQDSRFKHGCLSFQLLRKMDSRESAMNALLPSVLLRGTRRCPNLRSVTEHLDLLYGAGISPLVRRVGDYQTTGLYCSFMDDRFALPGDQVLAPTVAFLRELLLDSPLENGGFLPAFTQSEKRNLISAIESERNDKRIYAMTRLLQTMCGDDPFGLPRLGTPAQVAEIDPVSLHRHLARILEESPIQVHYVGSAPAEEVARLLSPLFGELERAPVSLPPQSGFRPGPGSDRTECLDVTQGKLCMGFVYPVSQNNKDYAAMQVLNMVLGGGMTSKLFQVVREKYSLCYSIGSGCYSTKGILTVSAGIDFDKEQQTREEVLHQLALCQAGEISDSELASGKEAILNSLRAAHDSPGAIEGFYATGCLSGMTMTPGEYMAAAQAVTREEVSAAARAVKLHSTYFLKGASK